MKITKKQFKEKWKNIFFECQTFDDDYKATRNEPQRLEKLEEMITEAKNSFDIDIFYKVLKDLKPHYTNHQLEQEKQEQGRILKIQKLSDELLEIIDNADQFTRSDLQ
jgi:hypothetical protein